jgi:hypothetical protein
VACAGTGESWLFQFPADHTRSLEVYHWTKKNEFFVKVSIESDLLIWKNPSNALHQPIRSEDS